MKFEIRMTACNRPAMLRRALQSIQAQAHPDWHAVVYDDSTDSESRDVIEALGEPRVTYRRNPERLGAARNLDQCLSPAADFGGAYGCLLEDDNYWFPSCLATVAAQLGAAQWSIVQTNQRIGDATGALRGAGETTRGAWFAQGRVEPLALRATLLFMEGVSNSGLAWRLNGGIDLRVAEWVKELALNEACRTLRVADPIYFIAEAQGVFTLNETAASARGGERPRAISRGMQSIRDYLLRTHGRSLLPIAKGIAARGGRIDPLVDALAYSGHPLLASRQAGGRERQIARALAKGLAVRLVQGDPCAGFLNSGKVAEIAGNGADR